MDASEVTRRLRERAIYASFLAQKNRIDGGCGAPMNLSNNGGASFESSLIPSIKEGDLFTTSEQRDAILAASACTVVETRDAIYMVGQFDTDPITFFAAQDEFAIDLFKDNTNSIWSSFLVKFNLEGLPLWSTRINSVITDNSNSTGTDAPIVHVSSNSTIYVVGKARHWGPVNYGMNFYNVGSSSPDISFTTTASDIIWLCEYNSEGQVQWATHMDGNIGSRLFITSDSNHNLYVQFNTSDNINIYHASDHSTIVQTINNISYDDTILIKYDSNGQYVWHSMLSGLDGDYIASVTCDHSNNVYVAVQRGSTSNLDVYTPPSYGAPSFSMVGSSTDGPYFNTILKYNSSGSVLWGTNIMADGASRAKMIVDSSNHLYVHAMYGNTSVNVYSASDQVNPTFMLPNSGNNDSLLVKYTPSGVATWASHISGIGNEKQPSIGIDSYNNLYVVAESNSPSVEVYDAGAVTASRIITFDGLSDRKIFIIKYNSFGVSLWASFIGPFPTTETRNDICVNGDGTLYITGRIYDGNTIQFYDASGNIPISAMANTSGGRFLFLVKYDSNGTPIWKLNTNQGDMPQISL